MNKAILTILLLTLTYSAAANERTIRGEYAWSPENLTISAMPPLLESLRESSGAPIYSIREARISAPDELESIRTWNQGNYPIKNGFSHTFTTPAQVEIDLTAASLESAEKNKSGPKHGQLMTTPDGDVMWSATIEVDNSHRLRLHLTEVDLPENARMWVAGKGDEVVGPFDLELAGPGGDIWTPSVAGPEIRLIVMLPESHPVARFNIVEVAQMFKLGPSNEPIAHPEEEGGDLSCLKQSLCVDVDTFPKIVDVEKAIGQMNYMDNGEAFVCTGGLIQDQVSGTQIPYFLTANHCFETQEVASTLEVIWDYAPDGCDGTKPDQSTLPRSNGSTLKATGKPADFLLLELSSIPAGRYFLGYDTTAASVAPGSILHRVHNPGGDVQSYSQTRVKSGVFECGGEWSNDTHIWQESVIGGTIPGSSGSPVLTADGNIVGQLSGSCDGPNGAYPQCSAEEPTIDGKLLAYWSEVAPFLDPSNNNNTSSDLSLASMDAANGSYAPGSAFNVTARVDNLGNATSPAFRITFYASVDTSITTGDIALGFSDRSALAAGGSDQIEGSITLPANISGGNYYIGAIITPSDSNSGNNSRFDSAVITVTGGSTASFKVNAGLSGAWYNPAMDGQGFLLEVLPTSKLVFVAWFTFDATRPSGSDPSTIGEHGQRWMTALGNYSSNQMVLPVYNATGGVFAKGTPAVSQAQIGTITVTFISCTNATIAFDLPGVPNATIAVQRLSSDNVEMCNSLAQ